MCIKILVFVALYKEVSNNWTFLGRYFKSCNQTDIVSFRVEYRFLFVKVSNSWTLWCINSGRWRLMASINALDISCLLFVARHLTYLCRRLSHMKNTLFIFLLIGSSSLFAQQSKTLNECIRIAWAQHPGFRNTAIRIKEARMDYVASVGAFLPRVNVDVEAGKRFGRSIDPSTNTYTSNTFDEGTVGLDMTLSLFEGFARINRVRFESLNRQQSKWERLEQQNELAYRVTDVYYKLLLEDKMLELTREQSRLGERYLRQTEVFAELGLKSASDLQEVRARHEGDLYRYKVRENSRQMTLLALKQLMNWNPSDTLIVQDTLNVEDLPLSLTPMTDNLYEQSLATMPTMRIMELKLKAARKQYAIAGGAFSPSVYARFSMASRYMDGYSSKQLNDNLGKYIGVGISIPLINGLERITTLRKQKLNLHRLRNEDEEQKQRLYTEVEQIVLSLSAGQTEHRQALLQLQAESRVLKESERKWEEGLIPVFQLMEARNRFLSAKAELVRVRLQLEMMRKLEDYYRTGSFCDYTMKD